MVERSTPAARCSEACKPPKRAVRRITDARALARGTLLLLAALTAHPARAELGATLAIVSDDRFRGASTSGGRPAATLTLSYDDAAGPYAGGSVTVAPVRGAGPRVLRTDQYAGYAARIGGGLSLDVGVINRIYGRSATLSYARRFAQLYAGLVIPRGSIHLFYAPDYDGYGNTATYLDGEALLYQHDRWSVNAHLGALRLPKWGRLAQSVEMDWRLGVSRRAGRGTVGLQWVGGGPQRYTRAWRSALLLAATRAF